MRFLKNKAIPIWQIERTSPDNRQPLDKYRANDKRGRLEAPLLQTVPDAQNTKQSRLGASRRSLHTPLASH
ncbi:MAG: hypothetical protein IT427_08030 [Pirellulales bacterium]|nr:hypothetical protein [Pirellulales bacterium]